MVYKSPEAVSEFYARVLADLRTIPGVMDASAVHCPPGAGDCGDWFYSIPGRPVPAQNEMPIPLFNSAAAGYFQMRRIPVLQGRKFNATDRAAGPQIAVINETFARTWWPNESSIGHQIKVGGPYQDGALLEIVSVAGDVRQSGLGAAIARDLPAILSPA